MKKLIVLLTLALVLPAYGSAAEKDETAPLRQALSTLIPGETPDSVRATELAGLYEVTYGPRIFYVSADGRFLLSGDLIDLKQQANLTEKRRGESRIKAVNGVGEKSMIVYAPEGKPKHTVTIFTDIDCPYCRKLHGEMKAMNDLGIKVRYLAMPRSGIDTPSYQKAVSVWCARDRNKSMDEAIKNGTIKAATCDNPVKRHMALAESLGVNGTPAIVLEDGRLIPGYVPAQQLLSIIRSGQ